MIEPIDAIRFPWAAHCVLALNFEDRLTAVRLALDYDLRDLSAEEHQLTGAAARLWRSNMAAFFAAMSHHAEQAHGWSGDAIVLLNSQAGK